MNMKKFEAVRAAMRKAFPELESLEDLDLVLSIGTAETPTTAKQILTENIGAPATVRRRLDRLVKLGIVKKNVWLGDGRVRPLIIDTRYAKRFGDLLQRTGA